MLYFCKTFETFVNMEIDEQHTLTLQRRNHELTVLNHIAEALNREVHLQNALQTALGKIVKLFDLTTGWIFLRDEESDKFYTAVTIHLPPALADHPRRMGGTCYCIDSYVDGDMDGAANINAILCTRLENLKDGTEGLRYHASIPLYAKTSDGDTVELGILNVASTDWEEISQDDLRVLHTVADLMSMAIQRARLYQKSKDVGAINERNRIAREIHDTIAQGMAATILQLETADALLEVESNTEKVKDIIQQAITQTRKNLDEARRSVMDLRAAPLEGKTLPEALYALLDDPDLSSTLETQCEIMGSGPPLSMRIATGLYRIAQEGINNVKQHAHASNLRIELRLVPEWVKLVIEDDGQGFRTQHIPHGHFGLIGMKERVKLLGGKINISSTPSVGTIIEVTIPLDKDL